MALFASKSDPARTQRDLAAQLKSKADARVDNSVRLSSAEAKLAEARSAVERLALDADDGKLDAGLAHRRACEDKLVALKAAGAKIAAEHTEIEAQIAKLIDAQTRAATAKQIAKLIEKWTEQEAEFVAAATALEATSREAALFCLDAHGTNAFLMAARSELPPAGKVIVEVMKQYAARVMAGHERPTLPQAPEPAKLALIPPIELQTIFALKNLKYMNATGGDRLHSARTRRQICRARSPRGLEHEGGAADLRSALSRISNGTPVRYQPDQSSCSWMRPGRQGSPGAIRRAPARAGVACRNLSRSQRRQAVHGIVHARAGARSFAARGRRALGRRCGVSTMLRAQGMLCTSALIKGTIVIPRGIEIRTTFRFSIRTASHNGCSRPSCGGIGR